MKTYATNPQIQKIHVLLRQLNLMEDKKDIVSGISYGRTESSKLLYFEEARDLIMRLADHIPAERMKSSIFSLAYRAGIIYGDTPEDKRINVAKLNQFLKQRGAVKKALNAMDYPELIKIHRQLEAVAKNVGRGKDNKEATQAVNGLLNELNLTTAH